ncbi:PP2C family protein-serine/threonine phosphatase [Angustibacter peucedani]
MSERRRERVARSLAAVWLLAVLVAVLVAGREPTIVLAGFSIMAPLIAAAAVPANGTGAFGAAAIALSVFGGAWTSTLDSPQSTIRIINVALVSVAAVVIAEVRERRERQYARVARIAEVAQRTILPVVPAEVGPVRTAARYVAAGQEALVGGDLFDCFHTSGRTFFVVGDVRGKGVGAVEQAGRVIRAFRQAAAASADLAEVAAEMSRYLVPFLGEEDFATAVLVAVDEHELTLVSCGHPLPLLIDTQGRGVLLELAPGLPLGLGDVYRSTSVPWTPGTRLLLYTDGLSEARGSNGEFLPIAPLAGRLAAGTVDDAVDGLLRTVVRYTHGQVATDDLAVLLLENTGTRVPEPDPGAHFLVER